LPNFLDVFRSQGTIELSDAVAERHWTLWRPGSEIVSLGDYLVLGVGPWCPYDMRMLDALDKAIAGGHLPPITVTAFDWGDLDPAVLMPTVPHLGAPHHTPLTSLWIDGVLSDVQWGYFGRKLVCDRYALPIDEIHEQPNYPSYG